jgi:dolichol-phosphate mannosyltransferase
MSTSKSRDGDNRGLAKAMKNPPSRRLVAAEVTIPVYELVAASRSEAPALRAAELSIIVPTFNERDNVVSVISAVAEALPNISWEIIFVDDDSPDGTAALVREIARSNPRVRCLHRVGRRGLSSGCVEGIMSTASPLVAVMDADRQHDERCLLRMFEIMNTTDADIVVGSRYVEGGGIGDWDRGRAAMSRFATRIGNWITGVKLSDPMSGFFMMRRDVFLESLPRLSSVGFKILLDISASSQRILKIIDVPYQFRSRQQGASKLDSTVLVEFFLLIIDKSFGGYIPTRFISFAMVGGIGVFVHLSVLMLTFRLLDASFFVAQIAATFAAISSNFVLNNALTYRDQRLHGKDLLLGWISFNAVCATGAAANVGVANWMFTHESVWFVSALAGIAVSVVWNYAMSSMFTWRKR